MVAFVALGGLKMGNSVTLLRPKLHCLNRSGTQNGSCLQLI